MRFDANDGGKNIEQCWPAQFALKMGGVKCTSKQKYEDDHRAF